MKPVYQKGDILRVENKGNSARFVIVFEFTKTGIPVVAPLEMVANGNEPEVPPSDGSFDGYSTNYKNAHWSKLSSSWQVYGYPLSFYQHVNI